MIISQEGVYVAGTHGFPVTCQLQEPQVGIFSGVSGILMMLVRPDGSQLDNPRSLPLPGAILDPDRTIQWLVQSGDLPTDGVYTVRFGVDYTGGAHLNFAGDFKVTDQ